MKVDQIQHVLSDEAARATILSSLFKGNTERHLVGLRARRNSNEKSRIKSRIFLANQEE